MKKVKIVSGRKVYTETVKHLCEHRTTIETLDKPACRTHITKARQTVCLKCNLMALDANAGQ